MMNQRPNALPASRAAVPPAQFQSKGPQPVASQFPPEHTDVIHDTQFDYYGELLATASSDRTIGIHVARAGQPVQRIACLSGHEGPVWMVAWAHPRFGRVLASASFDQKVIVWKEMGQRWAPIHVVEIHQGSVNAVCWAPEHVGPVLASASSDGTVAVTAYQNGYWLESVKLSNNSNRIAHAMGATSVSFAPYRADLPGGALLLASGGCDCQVRIWLSSPTSVDPQMQQQDVGQQPLSFTLHQALESFGDWVRDVAFSPSSAGSRHLMLAACGQDKRVVLFRKEWTQLGYEMEQGATVSEWERSVMEFKEPVWRLSWAPSGEMLTVTTASSEAFVLQEGPEFTEPWLVVALKDYQQ